MAHSLFIFVQRCGKKTSRPNPLADDIITSLEEESLLIEKNKIIRYYYCGPLRHLGKK